MVLAPLGQPEIGVRMVGRPGIQIEIELEDDMHRLKLGIGPVDRRNGVPDRRAGLDCACKEAVVLLASVPLLSGTTKPFSTADVMKAGKTARFFGYGINGLFLPSQVMQAEKTFSSSFMKRPVRTMCGCVLPRHEKTSGCEPRLGWLRADHAISSPHFGRPS